ncbi:anti-sigma factor RsbA family regulatory protein [Actinoplanes sp. NPDC051475]|uniref:anti-sigma factor RsbA family regulatory protein n=1 Tax=Actinoplanes sp. NPDC051475 TaxID=3157225 RepID=UPI00344F1F2E
MTAPHSTGYDHHVLFCDSTDALLAGAVPFLRAGLDAGEPAVLVCGRDASAALADAVGGGPQVTVVDRASVHTRTAHAVASYRQIMRRHAAAGSRRVRLVGEVAFGADPETWREWIRFEAVANAALISYPLSGVCAYDTRSLPEPLLAGAEQTHPLLLTPGGSRPNPRYQDPAAFLRHSADVDPDPLPSTSATATIDLTSPGRIAEMRHELRAGDVLSGLPPLSRSDLIAAVAEVAANGLTHGRPPVRVRLWANPHRVLCTVTDQGSGFDDPLAGYAPADTGHRPLRSGAGLWLARQCCDRLDMTTTPAGFEVRLSVTVPTGGPAGHSQYGTQARAEAAQRRAVQLRERLRQIEARLVDRQRRQDRGRPQT